jgi:hypothetical protein
VFLISVFLLSSLLFNITSNYFPSSDDISLMVNSTGIYKEVNPVEWFTIGFEDYFRSYTEWSVHSKEILRPVVNLIFFLSGFLFGEKYFLYLYFNILIHSACITAVFYLCRKYLRLNIITSSVAAFIMMLVPAVTNNTYFYFLAFSFDAVSALLVFFAFLFSIKRRSCYAFLFAAVALLTKETSLPIPFVVAFTLYLLKRKYLLRYLLIAFVIILFLFLFKIFFSFNSTSAFRSEYIQVWKLISLNFLKSLIAWPLGVLESDLVISGSKYVLVAYVLVNLFFSIILLKDIISFLKVKNMKIVLLIVWSIASLLVIVVFGLGSRFGYSFYIYFIPLVLYLIHYNKSIFKKLLYSFYCILIVISGISFFYNINTSKERINYSENMKNAKLLTKLLKTCPEKGDILLINDISANFSFKYLGMFAGVTGNLIKINSLANYDYLRKEENKNFDLNILEKDSMFEISIKIPENTDFWFEGIRNNLMIHEINKIFKRNEMIEYCFPEEIFIGNSGLTGLPKYNYGKKLLIYVKSKHFSAIWFNPAKGYYEVTKL